VRLSDSTSSFLSSKRRNFWSQLAHVHEQSEFTPSGSLVAAGHLQSAQGTFHPRPQTMMMMLCLPPHGTPTQHSNRHGPQRTQHTARTTVTPRYPQGIKPTTAEAPAPLNRSMLAPFGGLRPRVSVKRTGSSMG